MNLLTSRRGYRMHRWFFVGRDPSTYILALKQNKFINTKSTRSKYLLLYTFNEILCKCNINRWTLISVFHWVLLYAFIIWKDTIYCIVLFTTYILKRNCNLLNLIYFLTKIVYIPKNWNKILCIHCLFLFSSLVEQLFLVPYILTVYNKNNCFKLCARTLFSYPVFT